MKTSSVQRKCKACGTWNTGEVTHCVGCGVLIDPTMVREEEAEARQKKRMSAPRGRLDKFIELFKESRNPFMKFIFLVASAIWFVYSVILSFILWLIAAGPG